MARFAEDVAVEGNTRALAPKVDRLNDDASIKAAAAGSAAIDNGVAKHAESGTRSPMAASAVLRLQRSVGNAGTTAYLQRDDLEQDPSSHEKTSPVHNTIGSGGSPLDRDTRSTMESHLGTDLGDVRLHVDRGSAESVQAAAYTVGNDVVVHPDHYQAGTPSAQRTLAHELTHVVQQRSGPVEGTEREGGIKVSDPSDRFERDAESSADSFMSSVQTQRTEQASASGSGVAVQREAEGSESEDEEVQTLSLQREAEGSESEDEEVQTLSLQREAEGDETETEE